jgi:hypothetical protein
VCVCFRTIRAHAACTESVEAGDGELYLAHHLVLAEELPVNGYHGIYRRH